MTTRTACMFLALGWVAAVNPAQAQLVAVDNTYSVPYNASLVVEPPGPLENDTWNGDPVTDHGGTASLLVYPNHGFLNCDANPSFALCPNGSFTYTPDPTFPGFDSFVYQVNVGGQLGQATVTLSACSGGPTRFVCWREAPYLAKLGQLGYSTFQEGFEGNAHWGALREPVTAPYVIHAGLRWESNHPAAPANNELTTGNGAARTGNWGLYDPEHGYAPGTIGECDVTSPPPQCLYKDGFTGIREAGGTTLYGAGGYFTGLAEPNLRIILNGGAPIGLGRVMVGPAQFFGVIDTAGFTSFRFEEIDGKVGQIRFVFGDDFTFGTTPSDTTPPVVGTINSVPDTGDHQISEGEATPVAITQLLVSYGELVRDLGATAIDGVTNPDNYLLISDGGDGFSTVDCATGVDRGDVSIPTGPVTYNSGSELMATVDVNGGVGLLPGRYRLLVCGTTSIRDWAGNALDGNGNGTGGDDFRRNFTVTGGAAPGDVLNTLRVRKSAITPGRIRLSWSASCSPGAVDYAIYEGTIGIYYSHGSVACTDAGGDRVEEIVPQAASSYYLVVPVSATAEGSYGRASNGSERPVAPAVDRCRSSQVMGGCP